MKTHKFVRRLSDNQVLDIPVDQVEETLKRGGFALMPDVVYNTELPRPKEEPEKITENSIACPLCGFIPKNELGLKIHKRKCENSLSS